MQALARSAVGPSLIALVLCACAPKPSRVPLGLGPLALAERSGVSASEVAAAPARPAAAAPAQVTVELDEPEEPESSEPAAEEEESAAALEDATEGAANASATPPNWPGLYAGSDVATFRLPGAPDREQLDDKAKIRIEKASGGNVRIVLVNSDDGSDLCSLTARVDGNAALIEKPQPCFGSGEGSVQAELESGRAVLDGDTLSMDAEGSLTLELGEQEIEGEISYSFEGQRQ